MRFPRHSDNAADTAYLWSGTRSARVGNMVDRQTHFARLRNPCLNSSIYLGDFSRCCPDRCDVKDVRGRSFARYPLTAREPPRGRQRQREEEPSPGCAPRAARAHDGPKPACLSNPFCVRNFCTSTRRSHEVCRRLRGLRPTRITRFPSPDMFQGSDCPGILLPIGTSFARRYLPSDVPRVGLARTTIL